SVLFVHDSPTLLILPSFPTRRSSDLRKLPQEAARAARARVLAGVDLRPDRSRIALRAEAASPELGRAPGRGRVGALDRAERDAEDRKSTRLNSSHLGISYAVFCLKKK